MEINTRTEAGKLLDHFKLPRIVAEVGVAEGMFTETLLGCDLEHLYLVDSWQHLEQFGDGQMPQEWHDGNLEQVKQRTDKYKNKVTILKGLSAKMAKFIPDGSCGLIYIDADHSYKGSLLDLETYLSKLVDGGIMAGHDYLSPDYGVKQAVEEFTKGRFEVHTIPEEDIYNAGFWFIKK